MILDADGSACLLNCLSLHKTDITAMRAILSLMSVLRTGEATAGHMAPFSHLTALLSACLLPI